ncbi:histidinol-phosphate transaminase [Bacillus suaedaesalsae]|uniref:Histidinol-phosphate aminotransferase n=1 Tax=Bacillus suaedaesalsae TaxID=2810349 RepID=A0ABS2DMX9_9BACI|nr:histidinol-phosphate transaminase [Bacillus suaedaesalsae]MBM6619854.1 histidinol-phosphate transaminase [Bacillus suaedaesalsae]
MIIKQQLETLTPYQPGKPIEEVKAMYGLDKIVKLASNENPFGSSPQVQKAIQKSLNEVTLYPDGYASQLREKLALFLDVAPNQLIFGNGSDEVIQILCRALLSRDTNTVMATPTFPQYKHNAVIEGAEIREIELCNGQHDLEGMLSVIDEKTRIVWVCSPNNPTGTLTDKNNLLSFIEKVPATTLIVLDEAYYEYVESNLKLDSVTLLDQYKNVMILRTFSKIYGLASLRIGYGIGNAEFINAIETVREPFNTSRFAQAAAIAAISDQEFVAACREKNRLGLQQFIQFCVENELAYYPSQGNFLLIDFKSIQGNEVFQYLLERGFIVRSGNALGFPTCVRITVGSTEDNQSIISLLTTMLKTKFQVS